jgi:hypothetical protein
MKQKSLSMIGVFLAVSVFQGCATAIDRKIDQEVSQEAEFKRNSDLRTEESHAIQMASWLDGNQRRELQELRESTENSIDQIDQQSLKLRAVLVKDLIARDYDMGEITEIQERLKALENTRMRVISNAVDEGKLILGRPEVVTRY